MKISTLKVSIPERGYLHFDRPFFGDDALEAVSDPSRVATWSFMPFLHIELKTVKVKRNVEGRLVPKDKVRPIYYASHRDSALYYYYAEIMGAAYEDLLESNGLSECVTAFRKQRGRCNIHFALEVFEEIVRQGECTVQTFDISSFFENLDHKLLKHQWANLLGVEKLPPDHFNIFKSVTRYSFVNRDDAFRAFGISLKNRAAFKRRQICEVADFRKYIRDAGLIQRHVDPPSGQTKMAGIPQGSPISALLSNLYMLDFDLRVAAELNEIGGMYRRYCDDIICITPIGKDLDVRSLITSEITKLSLEAHPEKSTVHQFRLGEGVLVCDKPVQYLGFLFDGKAIRLRTAALSRYYAKMRGGIRFAHRVRKISDLHLGTRTTLKTKHLNIQYTYLGRRNFVTYAHRAARVMGSKAILKQLKPHLRRFKKYLEWKNRRWLSWSEEKFQEFRKRYLSQLG